MELKKNRTHRKNRLEVASGGFWGGQNGRWGSKGTKLPSVKYTTPGDVKDNMVSIVNNRVLYMWKLLRE